MQDTKPTSHAPGLRHGLSMLALALCVGVAFLSIGQGGTLPQRVLAVLDVLASSGWIPGVYVLGSFGFGSTLIRGDRWPASTKWVVQLCVGLVLSLSLSHGMGVLGILRPTSAWMMSGLGCVFAINELRQYFPSIKQSINACTLSVPKATFVVGAVLVIIMSCNPPGVSWDSEFNGFDELSYHLELPRQWMEHGRIWPSEQSVYSYLPSYVESAYVHMTALNGPVETDADGMSALWINNGQAAMATHLFSAMLAVLSAFAMGSLVHRFVTLHFPAMNEHRNLLADTSRAMLICLPWMAAVGTVAYNELAVVFLTIGALAIVIERDISPTTRSVISGILVAGACCCKPTAIFLVAPSIGVVLLAPIPFKQWGKPILSGCIVGLIVLLPWLIRNELASGNPVFPHAANLLGTGHWDAQQHEIFRLAHRFEGSMLDRLKFIVMPDPQGTHHVSRFRGLSNLQWGLVPIVGFVGGLLLLFKSSSRRIGLIAIVSIILPLLGWILLTHLQSRFLIPLAPLFVGVGLIGITNTCKAQLIKPTLNIIVLISSAWLLLLASIQSSGSPSLVIDLGPRVFAEPGTITDAPWTATINELAHPGETIYLLGDATPVYIRSPLVANTVYDHWLIQDAIEAHPNSPSEWTQSLANQSIDLIVVSFSEIERYAQSGWLPTSILESLEHGTMRDWISSLGEPIYIWSHPNTNKPIRAMYRIPSIKTNQP